jgi:hypothetical protein
MPVRCAAPATTLVKESSRARARIPTISRKATQRCRANTAWFRVQTDDERPINRKTRGLLVLDPVVSSRLRRVRLPSLSGTQIRVGRVGGAGLVGSNRRGVGEALVSVLSARARDAACGSETRFAVGERPRTDIDSFGVP